MVKKINAQTYKNCQEMTSSYFVSVLPRFAHLQQYESELGNEEKELAMYMYAGDEDGIMVPGEGMKMANSFGGKKLKKKAKGRRRSVSPPPALDVVVAEVCV